MSKTIKLAVLIIGAVLVALIVRLVVQAATVQHPAPVVTKRVRIAAADLPPGWLLRDADLAWKELPVADIPPNAVIDSNAPDAVELKGSLLREAVPAGQLIRSDEVILSSAPGFLAATLHPGMRAVSVAIDDVSGNAGLIEPGDYVDLLLTQQMGGRTDNPDLAVSSETVVQHVRILAVGSVIQRPKTDANGAQDNSNRARTVTLEVTPQMAEVVSVAARLGSLSLALRSFAITSRTPDADTADPASAPAPVWAGDISRAVRELPRPRNGSAQDSSGAHAVMVYRGSQKNLAENTTVFNVQVPPLPSQPLPH
jgi:pilus assembly protein CpaB